VTWCRADADGHQGPTASDASHNVSRVLASFTSVYLPTLSTVATLLALLTVYFARKDRHAEVVDAWLTGFQRAQERVAEAVIELAQVARDDYFSKVNENPLWQPAGDGVLPPAMRVPRMKLEAALAGLPTAGVTFPTCRSLLTASQADVIASADDALREVAASLNQLAQNAAHRRNRRSHSWFWRKYAAFNYWRAKRKLQPRGE